jgi:uncharacterized membrane protein
MTVTSPQPDKTPQTHRCRWGRLVLVTSLALNLAVLGILVGAAAKGGWHGGDPRSVRDVGFGPFTQALTENDRKTLRNAFMQNAPDMRRTRQSIRDEMNVLLSALRADPFKAAALSDALRMTTARARDRQELGEQLILDFVAALPAADRLAFADRLEAGLTRRPPPEDGRDRRREP